MTVTLLDAIKWQAQQEEIHRRAHDLIKDSFNGKIIVLGVEVVQGHKLVSVHYQWADDPNKGQGYSDIDFDLFFQEED